MSLHGLACEDSNRNSNAYHVMITYMEHVYSLVDSSILIQISHIPKDVRVINYPFLVALK